MKFLINLAIMFFLLINIFTANTQSLIQTCCKKAAARDPKLRLDFCIKSLEGHQRSKTAQSLGELATASMKNAGKRSRSLEAKADKILEEKDYGKNSVLGMVIKDCAMIYKDNAVTLKEAYRVITVEAMLVASIANELYACNVKPIVVIFIIFFFTLLFIIIINVTVVVT